MNVKRRISIIFATALCTSGVTGIAVAQTGAGPMLEEIIVTSRRYEENLQDAPLSVTAMTSDFIGNQKIETVNEMMALVPGGTWADFNKLQPNFSLRGIDSATPGSASIEASIQLVVDGIVNTRDSMKAPPLFDLERIEIMRGPQGSTFGRNASIGLVHFITKRPTQEFESGINLSAGTYGLLEVDGFFSGPLSDTVSGRVAYNFDTLDGEIESAVTGDGLDGDENIAIRGSLLFEPSDNFTAYLKAEYSEDSDDSPVRGGLDCTTTYISTTQGYAADYTPPCDVFKSTISTDRAFELNRDILSLTAEFVWNVGDGVAITSLSGYLDGESDSLSDVSGAPENVFFQHVINDVDILSTELRIDNHATGDAFRWLAGLYYLSDEEFRSEDNMFGFDNPVGPLATSTSRLTVATNQTDSIAVFGELSFDLTDEWNLTVGGRYTEDDRDHIYTVRAYGDRRPLGAVEGCAAVATGPPPTGTCGTPAMPVGFENFPNSRSWDNFSGRVSLQYDLSDTSMIYALYSEGFLSGGFQHDALNLAQAAVPFDEETVENFEIGWKADFDRARVAVTVFSIKEKDSQVGGLIPSGVPGVFISLQQNICGIETDGIEFEGTWLASDNFLVGGTFAFFDAEAVDSIIIRSAGPPVVFDDISGDRPNRAPEETATLWGEYTVNLGGGSSLVFRADYRHRSDSFSNTANRDTGAFTQPQINDIGARVSWMSADGDTRVSLWGKNLREDWDIVTTGPPPGLFQQQYPQLVGGRTSYGVTASFNF